MMLEERLTFCKSGTDLLLHSSVIADLVMKIEKTVLSCHKLEASLGQHMDKTALLGFAQQVIQVISITVEDRNIVDSIANGIVNLIIEGGEEDGTSD